MTPTEPTHRLHSLLHRIEIGLRRLGVNDYTLFLLLAGVVGLAAGAGSCCFA